MGAFEKFQGMVSAGLSTLDEGHELIQAARREYENARRQVADVAGTSGSEKIESLRRNLEAVLWALDGALLARDAGLEEFDSYLGQIGATGSSVPQGGRGEVGVPIPEAANPFRQELASTDDDDSEKSNFQRLMRGSVRGASDMKEQASTWIKSAKGLRPAYEPPDGQIYIGTGQADTYISATPSKTPDPADIVGNAAIVAVMTLEAMSRIQRRKKEKDG